MSTSVTIYLLLTVFLCKNGIQFDQALIFFLLLSVTKPMCSVLSERRRLKCYFKTCSIRLQSNENASTLQTLQKKHFIFNFALQRKVWNKAVTFYSVYILLSTLAFIAWKPPWATQGYDPYWILIKYYYFFSIKCQFLNL